LDSLEEAEYQETVNKMAATMRAVDLAEATGVHGSTPADGVKAISPLSLAFNSRFLNTTGATSNQPTARAPGSTSIRSDDVTLMVDNFDSFTWNIYQYLCQLGANVVVLRNDVSLDTLIAINPARLVISPGPGWPHEAGVSNAAIKHFAGKIPILGVCLGHECITEIYGGAVSF
jgi:carbamoylphosphate synthase small subunit